MNPKDTPRHIWAVGRNYSDHAKEMNAALPKQPLFFLKGGGTVTTSEKIYLPLWAKNIHHELELAFLIEKSGDQTLLSHITLALDLTERDIQASAKKNGEPWTLAKSFTGSCPLGKWLKISDQNYFFELKVNGAVRQKGSLSEMIFNPKTLLSFAVNHFPVQDGDVLLTGTPAGVNALITGDKIDATLWESSSERDSKQPLLACHWDVV